MGRRGASAERGAIAAFLVVAAVGLSLVVADVTSGSGLAPAPAAPPAAPAALAPAWALVPESAPWRLAPDSLPPRRIALLNIGDGAGRPPAPALAEGGRFSLDASDCPRVLRPGRGCLVLLHADPVEDGPLLGRLGLEGTDASVPVEGAAVGFSAQVRLQGEPVLLASEDPAAPPPSAAWRVSNVGPRPVRAPLSIEGGGFRLRASDACPEILPPGGACDLEVVFAPIAVGQAPGRLRAGAAEAALLGVVPPSLARASVAVHPAEGAWEAELRNEGALAFVAPSASGMEGAAIVADGCAGRPLAPGAACRVRLSGAGLAFFGAPVALFAASPP